MVSEQNQNRDTWLKVLENMSEAW